VAEQRDEIVKRVVHALEETNEPGELVRRYFDEDREVVIEATRQTLEATREDVSADRVAAAVDKELIEALRFPKDRKVGVAVSLYLHRGEAALASALVTGGALLAFLLL